MMSRRQGVMSSSWLSIVWMLTLGACAPTLAGVVKSTDGAIQVSPDARVNITSLVVVGERHITSVKVDERGKFSTRDPLPQGDYLIEALVPGYSVTSKKIRVGEKGDVTLLLQPVGQQKSTTIGVNLQGDQARGAGGATLTPPTF